MIKDGTEITNYDLVINIKNRINELIDFNLSPVTINLLTSEFSEIDAKNKEDIFSYISDLLEIETRIVEMFKFSIKKNVGMKQNSSQESLAKLRQQNLQKIQNIFTDNQKKYYNYQPNLENNLPVKEKNDIETLINNIKIILKSKKYSSWYLTKFESYKFQELVDKKRAIELAVFEQEQKIKLLKKQLEFAKINKDIKMQEEKLISLSESNKKIKEIENALKKYDSLESFPIEILISPEQVLEFERDKYNLNHFFKKHHSKVIQNLKNDFEIFNEETKTIDYEEPPVTMDDFFDVEGYDFCEFHNCKSKENHIDEDEDEYLVKPKSKINDDTLTDIIPASSFDEKEHVNDDLLLSEFDDQTKEEQSIDFGLFDDVELGKTVEHPFEEIISNELTSNFELNNDDNNSTKDDNFWNLTSEVWSEYDDQNTITKNLEYLNLSKDIQEQKRHSIINEEEDYLKTEMAKKIKTPDIKTENEILSKNIDEDILKTEHKPSLNSEITDEILKKIKKNSKAKDKKIGKILQEKNHLEKELSELKLKQKVEELRNIEIHKLKALESIENIIKHEKLKGSSSIDILKNKIGGHIAKTTLLTKQKASKTMNFLKDKVSNDSAQTENNYKQDQSKSFSDDNNKNEQKRIEFLERKNKLNIISNDEVKELKTKKANTNKISKYRLLSKNTTK